MIRKVTFRVTHVLTDCFIISLTINQQSSETLKTPAQVMTSWSLHRGLVTLHTAGSLGLSAATPTDTPKPVTATAARRGSYAGNNSELCERRAFPSPVQNVTLCRIQETVRILVCVICLSHKAMGVGEGGVSTQGQRRGFCLSP